MLLPAFYVIINTLIILGENGLFLGSAARAHVLEGKNYMKTELKSYLCALFAHPEKLFSDTLLVIVIGVAVVFTALILLTAVFWLFGRLFSGKTENDAGDKSPSAADQPTLPVRPAAKADINNINEEIIAVIAAAVASMSLSDGKSYTISKVRRLSGRPVWAAAGITESTRPF